MPQPIAPYLDILKTQLATSLMPSEENARRVALYGHRMLTVMLLRERVLPGLQRDALAGISVFLDELVAALGGIEGGMILIPQLIFHVRSQPDFAAAEPLLQSAVRLLAGKPGDEAHRLQQRIAGVTFNIQEAFSRAIDEQQIKPVAADVPVEALDAGQKQSLQSYLRARFPQEKALELGGIKSIVGGGSKLTLVVELRNAKALPAAVVVRVDKAEGVVDSTVPNEFHLIKTVFDAGVPSAQPLAIETDKGVIGAPFIVVSKVEGHNIGDWIEVTEPSRAFAAGLARALATLHNIPVSPAGDGLPGAKTSIKERLQQELAVYEKTWRAYGEPSIAMEQALAWVKDHFDMGEGQRSIIHCDVGCHNMLGNNGELTALLDWETAAIGNPAQDLVYTHHTVVQMMPWEDYLAEYVKAGGKLPSQREMDFYRLWISLFRIHYQFMARSFFFSGMSSSMIHAYATQHLHQHCDHYLHEAVKMVYENY